MALSVWATAAGFVLGATLASFLGLVADRLPKGRSVVAPRSRCDACGTTLQPVDLIPIVSFLVFKARCRHCQAVLPTRLLLVEVFFAVVIGTLAALSLND